jgi:hypothetical protein
MEILKFGKLAALALAVSLTVGCSSSTATLPVKAH